MSQLVSQIDPASAPATVLEKASGSYSVAWHASADAFSEDVWARCFPAPLEGRWWYLALERAGLEDQFKFAYAAVLRGGEIVAIAPAFQADLALELVLPDEIAPMVAWIGRYVPALRHQRTWFIGSPCAEEGTIGLAPGVSLADVLPVLIPAVEQQAKARRVHMTVWKDVPAKAASVLEGAAKAAKYFKVPSFPGTEIHDLPSDFNGFLAAMPSSQRYHFKKKLKTSRATLELDCAVIQAPDAKAQAEIWALFMQTYDRATTRFERLTPAFFTELAKAPTTHFILLRKRDGENEDGGDLVAFMLCYFEADCATNKFIGIDYTLGDKVFLYFRLFEEFILWANKMGATWLRSGQTGYRAKFDMGHEPAPLYNFAKNSNGLMNMISAYVGRSITWSTLDPDLKIYVEARARKGEKRG